MHVPEDPRLVGPFDAVELVQKHEAALDVLETLGDETPRFAKTALQVLLLAADDRLGRADALLLGQLRSDLTFHRARLHRPDRVQRASRPGASRPLNLPVIGKLAQDLQVRRCAIEGCKRVAKVGFPADPVPEPPPESAPSRASLSRSSHPPHDLEDRAHEDVGIGQRHEELLVDPDRDLSLVSALRLQMPKQAGLPRTPAPPDQVMEARLNLFEFASRRRNEFRRTALGRRARGLLQRGEEGVHILAVVGRILRAALHAFRL